MSTAYHKILIITAPSGAGKTSITKYLIQQPHVPQGRMKKKVLIIISWMKNPSSTK
jgi:guanylate kinase